MEDYPRVEPLSSFGHVRCGLDRSSALRLAGTFLTDRGKAGFLAAGLFHAAHQAVMLAGPAAAGGEVRPGIRGKQRRDQQQAEDHQQRMCYRPAHGIAAILAQKKAKRCDLGHDLGPFSPQIEFG